MAKRVALKPIRDNWIWFDGDTTVDYLPLTQMYTKRAEEKYVEYFIIHKNNRIEGV